MSIKLTRYSIIHRPHNAILHTNCQFDGQAEFTQDEIGLLYCSAFYIYSDL